MSDSHGLPLTRLPAQLPCPFSAHSAAGDPVLAFVSSHVASQPRSTQQQRQPSALSHGSSGGGSGAFELRTDARVWEVQWAELTVQRLLGRGSFGSVYLAEWNQVAVAVKVLISKGEGVGGQVSRVPGCMCRASDSPAVAIGRVEQRMHSTKSWP